MSNCPITGKPCNLQKVVHITEVHSDSIMEKHLCLQCGLPTYQKLSPEDNPMQTNFLSKKCDNCGMTLEEISIKKRLGCPKCYEVFAKEISPVLMAAHKSLKHVGKVPKNRDLKTQLEKAIKEENYEEAARIKRLMDETR